MEKFKIEKGVPYTKRHRLTMYPFSDMKVGDSFVVKLENRSVESIRGTLYSAAAYWALKTKKEWKFATSFEGEKKQVRIWRLK